MANFRSAFFAFPNAPAELKGPILTAAGLVGSNFDVKITVWPQLEIFGAAIPDEVRSSIDDSNVLICDITIPNLNVYYEIGYAIGVGKSLAPVLNASFADAPAAIQKDGLFDIIGYKAYENSTDLAGIITDLPSTKLIDLYSKPLNSQQSVYFLSAYRKTDFISTIASAIKDSKVYYRSFDPAEISRFSIIQAISDVTSSAGVVIPFLESYIDDAERHNVRASFLAGLAQGLGRETLLIRHQTTAAEPDAADYREKVVGVRDDKDKTKASYFSAIASVGRSEAKKLRRNLG
ncbi:MAG: hypothetical protein ABSG88_25380 [Bradyrhizobium sp.]